MNEDEVDLSSLDPARDAAHWNAVVRSIVGDAMAARAARAPDRRDTFATLAGWTRPALAAAGVIFLLTIPLLMRLRVLPIAQPAPALVANALGIPPAINDLLHSPQTPSLVELTAALNVGDR